MFLFIVLRRISFTNQFRSNSRRKDKHKNHACQSYKYMIFYAGDETGHAPSLLRRFRNDGGRVRHCK